MKILRAVLWLAIVCAVIAAAYGGYRLGVEGTAEPEIDSYTSVPSLIDLTTNRVEVPLAFSWLVRPSGRVDISIAIRNFGAGDDGGPEGPPAPDKASIKAIPNLFAGGKAVVRVLLTCGARLDTTSVAAEFRSAIKSGGDELACRDARTRSVESRAWQSLEMELEQESSGVQMVARTMGSWTDASVARRVARSPDLRIGSGGGADGEAFYSPGIASSFTTGLVQVDGEQLEFYSPQFPENGKVVDDVEIGSESDSMRSAIVWESSLSGRAVGGVHRIAGGQGTWARPGGPQRAQIDLLLSGALIGIAAAAVFEFIVGIAKGRRERPA